MKNFKLKLQEFGLADKEIKVIVFLSLTFFLGVALKVFKGSYIDNNRFDYSSLDRKFENYSSRLDSIYFDEKENTNYQMDFKKSDSSIVKDLSGFISGRQKKTVLIKDKKIDLNEAAKEELMLLPGIGSKMADKIILYRNDHGKFKNINEIRNIKGIGEKKFEQIKNNIIIK